MEVVELEVAGSLGGFRVDPVFVVSIDFVLLLPGAWDAADGP